MVQRILRVTKNTVFKLRPVQTTELVEAECHKVLAGTEFEISSYAYADANGDFNGHIKFSLKDDFIRGLNTWFVNSLHSEVEFDGEVVYPQEDQEVSPVLKITRDTLLKLRPLQSAVLTAEETQPIARGASFPLHSYAYADNQGDFSSHIKFALRNEEDYIQDRSTWYVYDRHAYVEFDGKVVYPADDPELPTLKITRNTLFKRRPVQSSTLSANEVYRIPKGSAWKLHSYAYADQQGSFNRHIKFALRYEKDYVQETSTWYVYDGHAQVEVNGEVVYPRPPEPKVEPLGPTYTGVSFRLPGNVSTFYADQPIIPDGHFTWGEATHNGERIPENADIVNNIIALARELEKARRQLGRPFRVNSWYRPPAINRAVGGASRSYHLTGRATDLEVSGYSGRRVANAVMPWWPGGIGIYSHLPNVVHLDVGPSRMWGF